jgi:hypothetical protein
MYFVAFIHSIRVDSDTGEELFSPLISNVMSLQVHTHFILPHHKIPFLKQHTFPELFLLLNLLLYFCVLKLLLYFFISDALTSEITL